MAKPSGRYKSPDRVDCRQLSPDNTSLTIHPVAWLNFLLKIMCPELLALDGAVEELTLEWMNPLLTVEEMDRLVGWHLGGEPENNSEV